MKNLYQLYFGFTFLALLLALIYFFLSNRTVTIDVNLFVVNDKSYQAKQNNTLTTTWMFIIVAFFTGMYYLNSIMSARDLSLRSLVYFLLFLVLFVVATILTMYAYSTTLNKFLFTDNYLYDNNYKSKQNLLTASFVVYFFMSCFSVLYLYSDSSKLFTTDPDLEKLFEHSKVVI